MTCSCVGSELNRVVDDGKGGRRRQHAVGGMRQARWLYAPPGGRKTMLDHEAPGSDALRYSGERPRARRHGHVSVMIVECAATAGSRQEVYPGAVA